METEKEVKETIINIHPILNTEVPINDELIPVMKEEELEDSVSQFDIVKDKLNAHFILVIMKKFIDNTKNYLNLNFDKLDYCTWQNKNFLIKHLNINSFVVISHGDDYIFRDIYNIIDVEDYNQLMNKLNKQ